MSDSPTSSGSEERSSDDSRSDNEAGAIGAGDDEAGATTEKEDEGLNGCFEIFLEVCVLWAILAQACEG